MVSPRRTAEWAVVGMRWRHAAVGVTDAAVVRRENDDRVVDDVEFIQQREKVAHAFVQAFEERGVSGLRLI
jgi:hypothetical protein